MEHGSTARFGGSDGPKGEDDSAFGRQLFDLPEAEAEAVVELESVADDLQGKPVLSIVPCGTSEHIVITAFRSQTSQGMDKVTKPEGGRRMYDVVIRGGTIVDGTGKPAFSGDVAIADGRVAAVRKDLGSAKKTVDADGLLVTPGARERQRHRCSAGAYRGGKT